MMKGIFDSACRGFNAAADVAWFFKDGQYVRYLMSTDTVDGGPRDTASAWAQNGSIRWPWSRVDATLNGVGSATYADKLWFFCEGNYMRYNLADDSLDFGPTPIASNWAQKGTRRWPFPSVDAAIHGIGTYANKAWFFKGRKYFRMDLETDEIEIDPTDIASAWGQGKWPETFATGIDCAFYGAGQYADRIYFFRGDQYIRYDPATDVIENGPLPIKGNWGTLYEQLYDASSVWGVDSFELVTHVLGSPGHTLYDYVVDHVGVQPHFWGRYLTNLARPEVDYLAARKCRVLLVKNGMDNLVSGGLQQGLQMATDAATAAAALGVAKDTAIFGDIEPGWTPTRDFLLGWMLGMSGSDFSDGLYVNPQATSGFVEPYRQAFAVRDTITAAVGAGSTFQDAATASLPQLTALASTFPTLATLTAFKPNWLWSQYPQVPNYMDNRGCPTGPEAMRKSFAPILAPTNGANTVLWQFKINCLPFPPPKDIHDPLPSGARGEIDNDLATVDGFNLLWDPSASTP